MTDPIPPTPSSNETTSLGLPAPLERALCYVLGWVSGVILVMLEKDDREVRFHAYQSIATFGGLFVLNMASGFVPFLGWLLNLALVPVTFILWIVLTVKAYQGGYFKLPLVGDWAEEQVR